MNILFTLSQLEVTGAEVFAVTIAEKLVQRGHSVFIVSDTLTKKASAEYYRIPLANRKVGARIKNTLSLKRFISKKNIDIVIANSRASAWVSSIACRMCGIPLIVVIHGRQSEFLSRRIFHGFGFYTLAVCEKLKEQLTGFFRVPGYKIEIFRNPFDLSLVKPSETERGEKVISLIGRLSGPKGELALKLLERYKEYREKGGDVKLKVIGGQKIPSEFEPYREIFEFTGFVEDIGKHIDEASLVIGSGRIAMESVLRGRPTVAIGEACSIGLISNENIDFALATNFGDMNVKEREFDFPMIMEHIRKGMAEPYCDEKAVAKARQEYDSELILDRLESICQSIQVSYSKSEIPNIYYHKVIKDESEAGRHGIYVTIKQFEAHLKYLKKKGFRTVSSEEALRIKKENRTGREVIITFDDGYEDNYTNAFPLLKKYGFNAEIFLVAALESNEWDRNGNEPLSPMLKKEQILEMKEYGIRFGSHTLHHRDLTKCPASEMEDEIAGSKKLLEEKLGFNIDSIAYPYGNYNYDVIEAAKKAGYRFGYATDKGPLGMHEDLFRIRRITIFPNTDLFHFARKVNGNYVFKKIKEEKDIYSFNSQR